METRCIIPIWQTFGRIQWHVIPEPCITLQGAATWWIHCYDSRATCHIAGCSHLTKSMSWSCHIAGCKNSIRHIENRFSPYFIYFLTQFRLWRAAAFVSSPICAKYECHIFAPVTFDLWPQIWSAMQLILRWVTSLQVWTLHGLLLSSQRWARNRQTDGQTDGRTKRVMRLPRSA